MKYFSETLSRVVKLLLLFALASALALTGNLALAQDEEIDGLLFELNSPASGEATITGYIEPPAASFTVPASVMHNGMTYSIASISNGAFMSAGITSVTLSDSLTSIGDSAFSGNSITSLSIPASVTTIGYAAFANNELTSLVIPDTVISIGDSAFYEAFAFENTGPATLVIGDGVTSIGESAFLRNNLTSVTLGSSLVTIGPEAFGVNKLTTITIPDSVTDIQFAAFQQNELVEVNLGDSVETIGESAFANNQLPTIDFPPSVTTIGNGAFFNNNLTLLEIPGTITSIGEIAFSENNNLIAVQFLGDYSPGYSDDMFDYNDQIGLIEVCEGSSGWGGVIFRNGFSSYEATSVSCSLATDPGENVPDIPQQSLTGIINSNGSASGAGISVGASSNGGQSTSTSFMTDDEITITAKIFPDPADIGQEGELYVVLRTVIDGTRAFVALNEDGQWEAWNASLKSLPAALYADSLEEVEEVLIYSGQMIAGERLMYVGYSLFTEDAKPNIHVNSKPFRFDVTE